MARCSFNLDGSTVLITGGAGVIGSAMCREFAASGAQVIISDIMEEKGLALEKELIAGGACARFIYMDITDAQSAVTAATQGIERFGKIDLLINNAGYNTHLEKRKTIAELSDEEWQKGININLTGMYYCSKPVVRHMVERGYGRIINIASVLGQVPLRNQAPYSTAKAAIISLTRSMAMELAQHNILVNCISPGSISHVPDDSTSFFYGDREKTQKLLQHIPLHRTGRPEEIARIAMFLCTDEAGYMTGNNLTVDGGWISGDLLAE